MKDLSQWNDKIFCWQNYNKWSWRVSKQFKMKTRNVFESFAFKSGIFPSKPPQRKGLKIVSLKQMLLTLPRRWYK